MASLLVASLPGGEVTVNLPHKADDITESILSTKLKSIITKFRQSVDGGKRSGHGRVVWIHYELCESIWGGSPPTDSIETSIESTDIESPSINKVNESSECDEVNTEGSVQQSITANDDCSSVSSE